MKTTFKKHIAVGTLTLALAAPFAFGAGSTGTASAASLTNPYQVQTASFWSNVTFSNGMDLNQLLQQYTSGKWQFGGTTAPVTTVPTVSTTPTPVVKPTPVKPAPVQPVQPVQPVKPTVPTAPTQPTQPTTSPAPVTGGSGSDTSASTFAAQVVNLVNQERAKAGLGALQSDSKLAGMAMDKAKDMYSKNYFDHTSPTFGSPFDMMKSYGISYSYAGENIAKGQRTPQEVMTAWMNSPGHKANILGANYTKIGVAYYNGEWVQEFIG